MSHRRSAAAAGSGVLTTSPTGVPAVERDDRVPLVRAGRAWPPRRVVAAALLTPALAAVLASSGGGWSPRGAPWWTTVVGLVAVVGAMTLATYVPRPGFGSRLDVGCSPCAVVAVVSVVSAAAILSTAPHQLVAAHDAGDHAGR